MRKIMKVNLLFITAFLMSLSSVESAATAGTGNKLLLILLDGFKWDYFSLFENNELSGFNRLRTEGASVKQLTPVFPSLSFPNYYSFMTGLYSESHGMVDNYMYDEKHDKQFLIGENPDQYHSFWWDEGEPLWITGKKQGKRSYFWYWCGCEVEIRKHRPDFCQEYLSSPNPTFENFTAALNQAVEVLRNGSADIAGIYFEQVDHWGHRSGSGSEDVKSFIRRIDADIARIQQILETTKMEGQTSGFMIDQVNLAIFSDHGMANRTGGASDNKTAVIHLLDYVNTTDYLLAMGSTAGPILSIWPHPGQEDELFSRLSGANPNMDVYRKRDIPEEFHLKGHYRIPEIYMVAKPGYVFLKGETTSLTSVGYHGYDNSLEDMQGIFLARGPDFKKGATVDRMRNVHFYELFCNILNIKPSPNNGTLSNTCDLVTDPKLCTTSSATGPVSFKSLSMIIYLVLLIFRHL